MTNETLILAGTAASIGFIHTLLGPDHYVPFIVLSKAKGWTGRKTAVITILCGLGHVLSSVLLGLAGLILGVTVFKLELIESLRGDLAGWLLLLFGFLYFVWGIHRAVRSRSHEHDHSHGEGIEHNHAHCHFKEHSHVHLKSDSKSLTPWILFTIFVFGPCEPLIPLIMYPAAKGSMASVAIVAAVFGVVTISTMLAAVMATFYGLSAISLPGVRRYSHALAGFFILLCGGAIKFLGL